MHNYTYKLCWIQNFLTGCMGGYKEQQYLKVESKKIIITLIQINIDWNKKDAISAQPPHSHDSRNWSNINIYVCVSSGTRPPKVCGDNLI